MSRENFVDEALQILAAMSVPSAPRNERSALTLLALIDLPPDGAWSEAKAPLVGVARIMDWIAMHYGKRYAPNTRQNTAFSRRKQPSSSARWAHTSAVSSRTLIVEKLVALAEWLLVAAAPGRSIRSPVDR